MILERVCIFVQKRIVVVNIRKLLFSTYIVLHVSMLVACATGKSIPSGTNDNLVELPKTNKSALIIRHTGYTLSYNVKTNCPNWVAWELTKDEVNANVAKRGNDFRGDAKVPEKNRVEAFEYRGSGYDRGHMCPAGDMKWSENAMSDCFYMSNICPQVAELNQKWWEHLERACRRWANNEGKVYVCCGPIYSKGKARYIGNDLKIMVPDKFFKVVLSLRPGNEKAIGFIYNNDGSKQAMADVVVTVDEVERLTGYDFFYMLDDKLEERLEKVSNLSKWK